MALSAIHRFIVSTLRASAIRLAGRLDERLDGPAAPRPSLDESDLAGLSRERFEAVVSEALGRAGFRVNARAGVHGGAQFLLYAPAALGRSAFTYARVLPPATLLEDDPEGEVAEIRRLGEVARREMVDALVVHPSRFSHQAFAAAEAAGVQLVDGARLIDLLARPAAA
jgi:hypothetical protein